MGLGDHWRAGGQHHTGPHRRVAGPDGVLQGRVEQGGGRLLLRGGGLIRAFLAPLLLVIFILLLFLLILFPWSSPNKLPAMKLPSNDLGMEKRWWT